MKRKLLSLLLTAAMLLSLGVTASAADGSHWAQGAAERWQNAGVIQGDDNGDLRLDDSMTRAELATVFVNLLGLTEEAPNTYADLTGSEWYAPAILKCTAAGIMQGDGANCNAGVTITRQETTVMTARALGIAPATEADLSVFADADAVADWAAPYVAAMAEAGIINGMGDGTVAPTADIDRASTMTLFDKAVAVYAGEPGEYDVSGSGIVIVAAAGVTLSGELEGSVLVAAGTADGAVTLDNATVTGTVTVASNAEVTAKDSKLADVAVTAAGASVALTGKSEAETVTVAQSAEEAAVTVAADAKAGTVVTEAPKASLTVAGTVTKAETAATAAGAAVTVEKGAKVETVTAAAPDSAVNVAGTVSKVETAETATGAKVETEKGASIKEVVANAEGTTVTGEAKVDKVTANADNTAVSTPNTKVEAGKDTTGVTVGDKEVKPGSSTTTNSSGSGTTSGSSGSSSSSHSHSYVNGVCASDGAISASATQVGTPEALKTALEGATTTIVLTADIEFDEAITVERNLAINLHGNTLTSTYAAAVSPLVAVTVTGAGHTLTIDDYGSGKITTATASNTVMAKDGGSVVLVKGTIENTGVGDFKSLRAQSGNVTVQGGTVSGTNGYGLVIFGENSAVEISGGSVEGKLIGISSNGTKSVCNGYTLNISGGAIRNTDSTGTDDNAAIYLPGTGGKATITGGEIIGGRIGVALRSGELTVNGGTITAAAARNDSGALVSGVTGSYTGALVIGKPSSTTAGAYEGNIAVEINGGTIKNETGDALCVVHESKDSTPAPGNVVVAVKSEDLLKGGQNIQDGFGTVEGDSLTLDGAAWVFSAESLAAAVNSQIAKVKVANNILLTAPLTINRTVTLDLNGKTLTFTDTNSNDLAISVTGFLTIEGNQGSIQTTAAGKGVIYVQESGTLDITDGTYSDGANNRWGVIQCHGKADIKDATIIGSWYGVVIADSTCDVKLSNCSVTAKYIAVSANGTSANAGYKLLVDSGTYVSDDTGMYFPSAGDVTITGSAEITSTGTELQAGESSAAAIGIEIRAGKLVIGDDVTVTCNYAQNGSATQTSGASGKFTGPIVIGKPVGSSSSAYDGDIEVRIGSARLVNTDADGSLLAVNASSLGAYTIHLEMTDISSMELSKLCHKTDDNGFTAITSEPATTIDVTYPTNTQS